MISDQREVALFFDSRWSPKLDWPDHCYKLIRSTWPYLTPRCLAVGWYWRDESSVDELRSLFDKHVTATRPADFSQAQSIAFAIISGIERSRVQTLVYDSRRHIEFMGYADVSVPSAFWHKLYPMMRMI